MVAADILEEPVFSNNNRYILVVLDYFTKWVEVVPMPDQTATHIVSTITKYSAPWEFLKYSIQIKVAILKA